MQATIILRGRCPVCGYSNQGVQVGTARPTMRQLRLEPGSIGVCPWSCAECCHPLGHELFDMVLHPETVAAWNAWRQRERQRQRRRRRAVPDPPPPEPAAEGERARLL